MKGLRAFLCRHPYLAILLPFIPCVLVAAGLVYYKMIDPSIALIALVWLFFLLSLPVRRIPHAVMREAALALERDLDPDAYLFHLDLLRARHLKNPVARISLGANYAAGLDAKGEYEAALAELRTLARDRKTLDVVNGVQFDLSYAVVAVHTEEGREEIPAVLSSVRDALPALPPALAAAVRETAESVRMAHALYTGAESDATLISYYVNTVNRYRREGDMSRRRLIRSCMNLARVYDRADRFADAAAMYTYVAENGGSLGVAREAKDARAALSLRESRARMEAAAEDGPTVSL